MTWSPLTGITSYSDSSKKPRPSMPPEQIRVTCCVCGKVIRDGYTIDGMSSSGYCQKHYREAMEEVENGS